MGLILNSLMGSEHAAPGVVFKPASSYSLKDDQPGPGGGGSLVFRFDWFWKPDGTRFWTRHGGINHPAFDNLFQFDTGAPWSLSAGFTQTGSAAISTDSFVRTMEWTDNGNRLVTLNRWFSSFRRLDAFDQSASPFDISGGLGAISGFTGLIGNEFAMHWNLDYPGVPAGTHVMINRLAGLFHRYTASTPGDITTLTGPNQTWDSRIDAGSRSESDIAVSPDGLMVYSVDGPSKNICSWELTGPFNFSAPFNFDNGGPNINLPTNFGIGRGVNIRPDTGDIYMEQDQNLRRVRCWNP